LILSNREEQNQYKQAYDSLFKLHQATLQELGSRDQRVLSETYLTRDSLIFKANNLDHTINTNFKKNKTVYIIFFILFGVLFILSLYLIIILRISRRETIEYLLSQTDGLSQQNQEIIEKANELKKVKKNLKEILKHQKIEAKNKEKTKKKRKK